MGFRATVGEEHEGNHFDGEKAWAAWYSDEPPADRLSRVEGAEDGCFGINTRRDQREVIDLETLDNDTPGLEKPDPL